MVDGVGDLEVHFIKGGKVVACGFTVPVVTDKQFLGCAKHSISVLDDALKNNIIIKKDAE